MVKPLSPFRLALLAAAILSLGGCASIPYAHSYAPPAVELPADGSRERARLNAEVYDAVVGYVDRLFYKADFGGVPFKAEARARRDQAVAQPTSDGLHLELQQLLDLLEDDHTVTLSPLERARHHEQLTGGQAVGYGIRATARGDERVVATVVPGTPAAEAGVLPGWRIESVGGLSALLAPPAVVGRKDTLVFVDENGQRRAFELEGVPMPHRARFDTRRLDGDVAYIRFDDFDATRYDQLIAEFEAFSENPPAGLILDLRNNGGGELSVMGRVVGWFHTDKQDFVVTRGRFINTRHVILPAPKAYSGPLVMLVGPATGSAAELLAGVAQEKGRAVVVGLPSRGAVTGTRPIELPDGGLLRVGMIVMTTPEGRQLEGAGVTPDTVVPDDWPAVREGRDPTLDAGLAALRALIGNTSEAASGPDGANEP